MRFKRGREPYRAVKMRRLLIKARKKARNAKCFLPARAVKCAAPALNGFLPHRKISGKNGLKNLKNSAYGGNGKPTGLSGGNQSFAVFGREYSFGGK